MIEHTQIEVGGLHFTFSIEPANGAQLDLRLTAEPASDLPDTYLLRFSAQSRSGEAFAIRDLSIAWSVPAVDMHAWYSGPPSPEELAKLPYWWIRKQVGANKGFPFVALFHRSGANRFAFGLLDQLTETALDGELVEATRSYNFHWHKPIGQAQLNTHQWQETLFVSVARGPWPEVLRAYVAAVDREWPQPALPVPASAYNPVFCTWTAIHHDVSQEWITRNARLAAELGFGTWLTDDGWFTSKASFADYRYTGDWQPDPVKFPDFAGHVRAVRELGLRYVLWVAPFMVGDASQAARQHAHMLTEATNTMRYRNMSPRRAETRQVVGDLVERLMREYQLDGLKIDFLDSIGIDNLIATETDYSTLGAGTYEILSAAIDRARAIVPDVLIEFRNSYTNLASRRYANLYRASDVPINFTLNRWQVSMLRLLAPDRAVHLDPALWHPDDTEENVAVQLINMICSVPMVSIELDRYPQSHLDLIRYWIGFYNAHRDTIVHGCFEPEIRLGQVPIIRFSSASERIVGVYDDLACSAGAGPLPLWILNASTRPFVDLRSDDIAGPQRVRTRDKFGRVVDEQTIVFPVAQLPVEVGGNLEIGY
ncbi:MAG TPA: glycoside hydrolase family 36 protein [Roseiflexaceae bacterium]|nr:glycoside hydrolase family 36 protein [Roseiflexaceae bacterium]